MGLALIHVFGNTAATRPDTDVACVFSATYRIWRVYMDDGNGGGGLVLATFDLSCNISII